jgi:hypothetical protein
MAGFEVSTNGRFCPVHRGYKSYGLGPTPLTLVLSSDGEILKSWVGAYSGHTQKEVESYFGITLPGLVREIAPAVPTNQ